LKHSNTENGFPVDLESFKRTAALAEADFFEFGRATLDVVKKFVRDLHEEQERNGNMTYLGRLDVFFMSMEEYWNLVEAIKLFVTPSEAATYLWVSCATFDTTDTRRLMIRDLP